MSKTTTTRSILSLPAMVFIVFLVLKLAEIGVVATWSWWLVCAPLWIPPVMGATALIIWLIGFLICSVTQK